jgi:hypothetical protein
MNKNVTGEEALMQRWDYIRVKDWDEVIVRGQDGWELVAVNPSEKVEVVYYLKRRVPSIQEQITEEQTELLFRQKGIEQK